MFKVRVTRIDSEGRWLNICEVPGADDLPLISINAYQTLLEIVGNRTFTCWRVNDMEDYVVRIHGD